MSVPTFYVAIAGLFLLLTGVSTEIDANVSNPSIETPSDVKPPNSVHSSDVFAFDCKSVCGNAGKVLRCELKTNGDCAKRYYVMCKGKDQCQWETIRSSCEEERTNQDECERFTRDTQGKAKKRSEAAISYLRSVGIVPALRRRFNSVRRRDLAAQQPYSGRSSVMTSGNGHAYAMDDNQLVESHYGRPAAYYPRPENDNVGFPFSFLSQFSNPKKPSQTTTGPMTMPAPPVGHAEASGAPSQTSNGNTPPQNAWNGYQNVPYSPNGGYNTIGHYPVYQSPNEYGQAFAYSSDGERYPVNENYNTWGSRPRTYSPFTSFFNAVGLQDPMLLLQYLPIG